MKRAAHWVPVSLNASASHRSLGPVPHPCYPTAALLRRPTLPSICRLCLYVSSPALCSVNYGLWRQRQLCLNKNKLIKPGALRHTERGWRTQAINHTDWSSPLNQLFSGTKFTPLNSDGSDSLLRLGLSFLCGCRCGNLHREVTLWMIQW